MGETTGISWCDSTHNPWFGCTKVSPACDHCYAERDMDTRLGKVTWGAGQERVRTMEATRRKPLVWNSRVFVECCDCGHRGEAEHWQDFDPVSMGATDDGDACKACKSRNVELATRRVFGPSLGDWLDNEVPIEWLVDYLETIRRTPNLDWLLLTKRIGNWRKRLSQALDASNNVAQRDWIARWLNGDAPHNVWIGATIVTQDELERDILKLLLVPARIRFLSIEPMIEAVDPGLLVYREVRPGDYVSLQTTRTGLHWIIAGGESGPHARPVNPAWAYQLRDECEHAGVPFHWKQWGEWAPKGLQRTGRDVRFPDDVMDRIGKKRSGCELEGKVWKQFPTGAKA